MDNLAAYFSRYEREHHHPVNQLLHVVGIPTILAGVAISLFASWRVGVVLFVSGWLLLFLGHRIEGNRPAFFQGPIHFLIGPAWAGHHLINRFRRASVEGDDRPD